jgi:hypothetical protein
LRTSRAQTRFWSTSITKALNALIAWHQEATSVGPRDYDQLKAQLGVALNIPVLLKHAIERGSFAKISREEAEHALQQMIKGDLVPREDIDRY